MILPRQTGRLAVLSLCVFLIAVFLTVCDDRESERAKARKAEAQRQEQLQAQLRTEQAQRLAAERSAQAAASSLDAWITGLSATACAACVIVLLIGVHIGSRAVSRYRKEHHHG